MNVAVEPLSRIKISRIAQELRKQIGCEDVLYFPIVQFIEWFLMDSENGMELEIVEPHEMLDTYGTTNTGRNVMRVRSDVYDRAVEGNPRDRFTLCHELGHYLLHQPEFVSYARGSIPTYRNPEWQANTFAAELMAPRDLVKDMTVDEIMETCGMSRQAASIQYKMIHN